MAVTDRGLVQAAGSWSMDACCAVHGNDCDRTPEIMDCVDRASSSDWLFGLGPGVGHVPGHVPGAGRPPQRFEPIRTDTAYQTVWADWWPEWGFGADLGIGRHDAGRTSGAPGGSDGVCAQGYTYRGTVGEICGGDGNWGATGVEVWYPR